MLNRILFWMSLLCFLLTPLSIAAMESDGVEMAVDLTKVGEQAKRHKVPIMIFFAAVDCGYCERLEADYLHAMANSAKYKKRVIIRKVVIDGYDNLRDFTGKVISSADIANDYNIDLTPTLVMVNHAGTSIGRNIVGYTKSGFFGASLDNAIDSAAKKLR